jgi:hypothetical protein
VNTATYNAWMLGVTAAYMVITLLLFITVAYETWHKPRAPDLRLYPHRTWWDWKMVDLVLENQGSTLRNLQITSAPEDLGWGVAFRKCLVQASSSATKEFRQSPHWPKVRSSVTSGNQSVKISTSLIPCSPTILNSQLRWNLTIRSRYSASSGGSGDVWPLCSTSLRLLPISLESAHLWTSTK